MNKFRTKVLMAGAAAALVLLSGCKSRETVTPSEDISNTDKPYTAVYSVAEGSAEEDIRTAADIIGERLKAVFEGDFSVTAEGDSVKIELPDKTASEAEELLEDIERTALLTFRMGWSGDITEGGSYEDLEHVLTGTEVTEAYTIYDEIDRQYIVYISLDEKGTEAFKNATQTAFEENRRISVWLDGEELIAPNVSSAITDGICVIQGNFTYDEAVRLASLIRLGALPVDLTRTSAE